MMSTSWIYFFRNWRDSSCKWELC